MGPRKQRILAVMLITLAIVGVSVGAVFAYLSATSGTVQNTLTPDQEIKPTIAETFDGYTKNHVSVDVGDPGYAVYVRVAIVATWEDDSGNIHWQMPVGASTNTVGVDYVLNWNSGDWFYNPDDGFYYLKTMISEGETPELISACYQTHAGPDVYEPVDTDGDGMADEQRLVTDYKLHVEIIAQTIQALGTTDGTGIPAVTDAWGIRVNGSKELYNTVTVQSGETLSGIADSYATTVEAMQALNEIENVDNIPTGAVYYLPNVKKTT